jgi:hypothetical protein
MDSHKMNNDVALIFVLSGKAVFTLLNPSTGNRFTYKVSRSSRKPENSPFRFVAVLTGSGDDYHYLGLIGDDGEFHHGFKSSIGQDSPSARAFAWYWRHRENPSPAEVWHEGRCGRCGRALTVPQSIETGLGPICAAKA